MLARCMIQQCAAAAWLFARGSSCVPCFTMIRPHCVDAAARCRQRFALFDWGCIVCVVQVLIFTGSVEEGLGLRLFLEAFGLRMGCLHAELPVNSRSHILASFNKGLFDFLIAVGEWLAVL